MDNSVTQGSAPTKTRQFSGRDMEFPCRVTFRLTKKHFQELEELAMNEGMTRSFMVRHLVVRYLESCRPVRSVPSLGSLL